MNSLNKFFPLIKTINSLTIAITYRVPWIHYFEIRLGLSKLSTCWKKNSLMGVELCKEKSHKNPLQYLLTDIQYKTIFIRASCNFTHLIRAKAWMRVLYFSIPFEDDNALTGCGFRTIANKFLTKLK